MTLETKQILSHFLTSDRNTNLKSHASFQLLPEDIGINILKCVSLEERAAVALVCRDTYFWSQDRRLWSSLYISSTLGSSSRTVRFLHSSILKYSESITSLDLRCQHALSTETLCCILRACRNIRILDVSGQKDFTDLAASTLSTFVKQGCLRVLRANCCVQLTGKGLSEVVNLAAFQLEEVSINWCRLVSLGESLHLPNLRILNAKSCHKVTSSSLARILKGSPLLKELRIGGIGGSIGIQTDVVSAVSACPRLKILDISSSNPFGGNRLLDESQLLEYISHSRLEELGIRGCSFLGPGLLHSLPSTLVSLDCRGCRCVTNTAVWDFSPQVLHLTNLQNVKCDYTADVQQFYERGNQRDSKKKPRQKGRLEICLVRPNRRSHFHSDL